MKKILITGQNSYIGNEFEKWVNNYQSDYKVEKSSLKDPAWRKKDFSPYDVVFHVAGIAHVSTAQEMEETYYRVNRDLTIECAKKAKADGVKQFIFLSSIIIYGDSAPIGKKKIIDKNTKPNPSNFYGKSKLQAEEGILTLADDSFKVVILRPPMVYGNNSKGNYLRLSKLAKATPIFPNIDNERSMVYVESLCELTRLMIDNEEGGIFFPQNKDYIKTSEMVKVIGKINNKNIRLTRAFNGIIKLMAFKIAAIDKMFGNLVYDKSLSEYKENYRLVDFRESLENTEDAVERIEV